MMKAAYLYEYGPEARFKIVDIDKPAVKPTEVLVKVEAAGIIYSDVLDRTGKHGPGVSFPYIPGWEVAGTVEKVGSDVTGFEVGQRVAGTFTHGGYAEYASVPARTLRPIPGRASYQQALVYLINLPVAYLHYNVFGKVQPGETILVHAGAGGVGSMLTQVAKRHDVTVIALSSTDEKLEYCKEMGADHLINYRKTDYVEAVKKITDNRGVDVVFNGVGGETLTTDPKVIKRLTGRWVIIGAAAGLGLINPYSFIYDSITIRSCSVLTLEGTEEQKESRRFLDEWLRTEPLIEPAHVFKLDQVNEAHLLLEQQRSHGKVILLP
jgi:NADPH2:quinone reductase